jgi:sec-independent protein translocase protein TatB
VFGIGGQELILLMLIGLIVLGPERLPRVANQLGSWLGQARRMTRVMKRQLEEELNVNQPPTVHQPPSAARKPSFQPAEQTPPPPVDAPSDDDTYSAAHDKDEAGTGVGEEEAHSAEDIAAADAERDAVTEASTAASAEDEAESKKEAP